MHLIFFDHYTRQSLLPLTFTRPACEIRVGIQTIREKWQALLKTSTHYFATQEYLSGKYSFKSSGDDLWINGSICPDHELIHSVETLENGQGLYHEDILLAARVSEIGTFAELEKAVDRVEWQADLHYIDHPWKVFVHNGAELEKDFERLTAGRSSSKLSDTNTILGDRVFAEEGVEAEAAVLNSTKGPIYLGKESVVMEGAVVRGPFALCDHAQLKLSAKIYGPTTIGPHSKVGGEVNNSVIIGYSNKGHDGFMGQSVLGEWCNIGADSNTSNLKNNYAPVKLWSYTKGGFVKTGQQFCGLIMGDHSKCGINTMFNTGTVVGVSANIYGSGFPRNFIPSFSWGGASGMSEYRFEKAMETAELVMQRRQIDLDETERAILQSVFDNTAPYRR